MCAEVYVLLPHGEVEATTRAQLRDALGAEPVRAANYHCEWPDDGCLCPCDLAATARAAGMTLGEIVAGAAYEMVKT